MSIQDAENKRDFVPRLLKVGGRSVDFAQFVFLFCGVLLTLSGFFILKSFVHSLVEDESARVSQDFVEEVVQDFYALTQPLVNLSELIALSQGVKGDDMKRVVQQNREDYTHYSQIIWFYQNAERKWTFSPLLGSAVDGAKSVRPDGALLKSLMAEGTMDSRDVRLLSGLKAFETQQHRSQPKISSRPFIVSKAVAPGDAGKGVLVAVLDTATLFNEVWIRDHRMLSFVHVQDVNANMPVFEFDRTPEADGGYSGVRHAYEFPFAGRNLEVSSVFVQDQRSNFLNMFPYVMGILGLFFVAVGALYLRRNEHQADALAKMNDRLEQKNFELKAEAEERDRLAQTVRDTEKRSRAVVDAVGDIIFEVDEDGLIVFLNKAWKNVTGFDAEQTLGQSLEQLIHPEDAAQLVSDFRSLVSGQKKNVRNYTQVRISDGTFKAVELSMNMMHGWPNPNAPSLHE